MTTTFRLAGGLLLLVALAGCEGDAGVPPDPAAAASIPGAAEASPTLLSMPEWDPADEGTHVPVEAGTYLVPSSAWSVADFTVTFPEGWTVQYGHVYAQHGDTDEEFGFYPVVVDEIFADACRGEGGPVRSVDPGVQALITALQEQTGGARKLDVTDTIFGGYPATRIELTIPDHADLGRCQMADYGYTGLQVWYSAPADKYFVLLPGAVATVYAVDVHGERQVFLAQLLDPGSDADLAELDAVLDSIDIAR